MIHIKNGFKISSIFGKVKVKKNSGDLNKNIIFIFKLKNIVTIAQQSLEYNSSEGFIF